MLLARPLTGLFPLEAELPKAEIPFKQSGLLGKILLDRLGVREIFGDDRNFDHE